MLPTRADKMDFITDLLNAVKLDIGRKIATDAIPAEWDGWELRQLLKDQFGEQCMKMERTRMKAYQNTVIINNL